MRIADLTQDSPAEHAGLQKGDIIIMVDQYKIANLKDYSDALKKFNPGDTVDVTYLHDGIENKTQIKLTAK